MPYQPRVLLVIADSSRTGGPEHVLTLARELRAAGWQVAVAAPPGDLVDRCQSLEVTSLPLGSSGRDLGLAPIRLRQLARRYHADLVHSHGLRAGWLVRRARLRVPWVHTHHLDSWFTANPVRTAVHRRELRAIGRRARLQIAVSQSVFEFVTETVGTPAGRVRVVPNGIDPLRPRLRARPAGARVGVLASLTPSKGVDLALMALATPPGRELSLVVGGQGPELQSLVDLAERLQVAGRVDFVGPVTDRQRFFDSCDVVWVPSRAEPFGLVACEAMSAGLPVVGTRVGGLPEILDPPRSGALVAPANPTALASVTAALLRDGDRYRRLSEAGPERVRLRYSAARMAALTRGVYREVLD
ncbi:MAG: glycosyltransferase family 4 protein [Candidatus Dormibacteria bacterium]|jgi:1,4-alpha-glucan branching enzyme